MVSIHSLWIQSDTHIYDDKLIKFSYAKQKQTDYSFLVSYQQ